MDEGQIVQETFIVNFLINVIENPRFKSITRINELFSLSKKSQPNKEMALQRMVNRVNRVMKAFSSELKVDKGSGSISITPLWGL